MKCPKYRKSLKSIDSSCKVDLPKYDGSLISLRRRSMTLASIRFERALSRLIVFGKRLSIFLLMSLLGFSGSAMAKIDERQAIDAIIGEAANQSLMGKQAVAEAIRNRGHLRGVYGLKRKSFIESQPKWVRKQAEKAWRMSANSNLVKGADHWESTDFPRPKWAEGARVTAHIGKHIFYSGVS